MPENWNTSLDKLLEEDHVKIREHLAGDTKATARALNGSKLLMSLIKMFKDVNNDGAFGTSFSYDLLSDMDRMSSEALQYGDTAIHVRMALIDLPEIKNIPTRKKKAAELLAKKGSAKRGKVILSALKRMPLGGPAKEETPDAKHDETKVEEEKSKAEGVLVTAST